VAQAVTKACSREEGAHALGGAVEAIDEDTSDPIRRLLLRCYTLKLAIGLGKSRRTGLGGVPQMPDNAATDNRRQVVFQICTFP
jgi:hypothetical protein